MLAKSIASSTKSPEAMQAAARDFAKTLPPNSVLALHGDLGAGKTTFVGGLAQAWAITDPITSPTYAILNVHEGSRRLIHMDAYRLKSPEEVESLGLEELLVPPYCWVIEWPERLGPYLPHNALHLWFEVAPGGERTVKLSPRMDA